MTRGSSPPPCGPPCCKKEGYDTTQALEEKAAALAQGEERLRAQALLAPKNWNRRKGCFRQRKPMPGWKKPIRRPWQLFKEPGSLQPARGTAPQWEQAPPGPAPAGAGSGPGPGGRPAFPAGEELLRAETAGQQAAATWNQVERQKSPWRNFPQQANQLAQRLEKGNAFLKGCEEAAAKLPGLLNDAKP